VTGVDVVAVIAAVACNARNAAGSGCVQRRNNVANCQWTVIMGDWCVVLGH